MTDDPKHRKRELAPAPGRDNPNLDPFEIEFPPEFRKGRGPREPFVNSHGVVIGDHDYASPNSPLERWSAETDPAVMAGDEWVHPFKDIGFRTRENRDRFERGIAPQAGPFAHPTHQTARPERPAGKLPAEDDEREARYPVPEVLDEP